MTSVASSAVSVIVPAFNAAPYLKETLDSVFAQTRVPAEVIVVDDGSTDNTCEIARSYGPRVRLLQRHQGGAAAARNLGASQSSGEWLAFLDADDVWVPTKLERQLALVDEATGLVYCDRMNIGVTDGLPERQSDIQPLFDGDVFVDLLIKGNVITTSGVLLRADIFRELGGFDHDARLLPAEDWDLWLRVAARYRVRACRETLIRYRLHSEGASRRFDRMMEARRLVVSRALESPRGRALPTLLKRRIWSETWRTNGWDATRHGALKQSLAAYLRAMYYWPFQPITYTGIAKAILGRG